MKLIKRCFCNKNISDYYEYMAKAIGTGKNGKNTGDRKIKNDENELVNLLKCPMTDGPLILEDNHLKSVVRKK